MTSASASRSRAHAEIAAAWHAIAGEGHDDVLADVLRRHAEAHRHYHTAEHVMSVVSHLDALITDTLITDKTGADMTGEHIDRDALIAAALFHDSIYEPRSATNEASSADLADVYLARIGWPATRRHTVAALIRSTARHDGSGRADALLSDADLAVLGADPDEYAEYVSAVRAEHADLPDDLWRAGRADVLRGFIGRPHVYKTATMLARREQQARRNMQHELDILVSAAQAPGSPAP
ncbi:MAG: metal-dependent phosphohydrolase [Ilumatobacteraceae bacterium]